MQGQQRKQMQEIPASKGSLLALRQARVCKAQGQYRGSEMMQGCKMEVCLTR